MRYSPNKKVADLKKQLAKAEEVLAKKREVADSVSRPTPVQDKVSKKMIR
jgi:hypothetical protein